MKIKTKNYDGTIIEVEVNINVYNYDKKNYWKEGWRNRKSKQENSYEDYYEKKLPHELWEESMEEKYFKKYEYEQLYKAINKLPKKQRKRIILRYFYELSIEEISRIENSSTRAIKASLHHAQKFLKNIL